MPMGIVCDPRRNDIGTVGDFTFPTRDAAAEAERALANPAEWGIYDETGKLVETTDTEPCAHTLAGLAMARYTARRIQLRSAA